MSAISLTRDISPPLDQRFSTELPCINANITSAYSTVLSLLKIWDLSTDPKEKESLYENANKTFEELKLYSSKKVPQIWRKEILYLETCILKKSLYNIFEWLSGGLKQIKEIEEHVLASIEPEEISQNLDTSNSYPIAEEVPFGEVYILTGRVKRIPIERASDELRRKLKLGQEIIRHTQECIPYSSNYLKRNPLIQLITDPDKSKYTHLSDSAKKIKKTINKMHTVIRESKKNSIDQLRPFFNALIKTFGIGNCEEMATFAFYHAKMERNILDPMEIVKIKDGDHAFIVIDPFSLEDSVFCDPWTGSCYPESVAHLYLRNYVRGLNPPPFCTTVEAVDPSRVQIQNHYKYYYLNCAFVATGNTKEVKTLLEKIPRYTQDKKIYQELVEIAFDAGHFDVLALLLEKGNPQTLTYFLKEEIIAATPIAEKEDKIDYELARRIFRAITQ
jgi:hypothetical protein